jgi:hypothetical protein
MKSTFVIFVVSILSCSMLLGQDSKGKKVEKTHAFYQAVPDSLRGDWQGDGNYVAQVIRAGDKKMTVNDMVPDANDEGKYIANVFHKFDITNDKPILILEGIVSGETITFSGDGWAGTIAGGHFKAHKGIEKFDLLHTARTPPTLGAKPPAGAVVLFDGTNMDAWAKKAGKEWTKEDGPSPWKLVEASVMEVVPGADCIITHKWFGDFKLHLEFRNLGGPTNSGVYLQTRYELNINEIYGNPKGNPCAGFDNCTEKTANPGIRCSRPPLEWQTMDIEFHAPRFGADGNKIASARATNYFNGILIYNNQELDPPGLSAARLGEAPTGPIMLQEHGMPLQFRNIWAVETLH